MLPVQRALSSNGNVIRRTLWQSVLLCSRSTTPPVASATGSSPLRPSLWASRSGALAIDRARDLSTSAVRRQQEEDEGPREMDSGEKDIHDILTREFQPRQLQVQDVSGGCGSFYSIAIISSKFKGVPTVKAHRMVNDALKDIIKGIHGLQLRTIPADD